MGTEKSNGRTEQAITVDQFRSMVKNSFPSKNIMEKRKVKKEE